MKHKLKFTKVFHYKGLSFILTIEEIAVGRLKAVFTDNHNAGFKVLGTFVASELSSKIKDYKKEMKVFTEQLQKENEGLFIILAKNKFL